MMRPSLAFAVLVLLAGCKAPRQDDYPSLLPRPIEKRGFADPVAEAPPVARPDPALDAAIARQRGALGKAAAAFRAGADRAERLAGRARTATPGSEPWIAAQVALAELDTLRSGTVGALADIEKLAIDRAAGGEPPYPTLQTLLNDAQAQSAEESARIGRIDAMMRRA